MVLTKAPTISREMPRVTREQRWSTVQRSSRPGRLLPQHRRSTTSPYTAPTIRRWPNPSRRRPQPRFVPKFEGNEPFPRPRHTLPTLVQFLPKCWGQASPSKEDTSQEKTSSTTTTCNVILTHVNTTSSDSEELFTHEERQLLCSESEEEGTKVEVNMNLRGGKVLPEPPKLKPMKTNNTLKETTPPEVVQEGRSKQGSKPQDVD